MIAQWLYDRIFKENLMLSVHMFSFFWYVLLGRQQGTRVCKLNFCCRTLLFCFEDVIASGTELLYLSTVIKKRLSMYPDALLERFTTSGNSETSSLVTFSG